MSPVSILNALVKVEPDATEFHHSGGPKYKSSSGKTYFCKKGGPGDYDQFNGEAESLKAMTVAAPGLCPRLLYFAEDPEEPRNPVMISEFMELNSLSSASSATLARRLALELHDPEQSRAGSGGQFGFACVTYCGVTRLENRWHDTWEEAFSSLIQGLLNGIKSKSSRFGELCRLGEQVVSTAIPHLLNPMRLQVEPVILHGDLWSGNTGTLASGDPIIFDPASYYGHNEADLAIARMFGGFPSTFWTKYHEHRPKSSPAEEYDERQALYELFHYLNHTLIFGASYASPSISRMKRLLKFVESQSNL